MEREGSLPHSQVPAICPYPESYESSPCLPIPLLEDTFLILFSHVLLGLPSSLFPSGLPTKTIHELFLSPIRVTYPACHILLDLVTRIIFGERSRSLQLLRTQSSPLPCYLVRLRSSIFLSALLVNTISLCFSLIVRDQASHPSK